MSEALWRSAEYDLALGKILPSGPEEVGYLAEDQLARHDRLARLYELQRKISGEPLGCNDKEAILSKIAYGIMSIESGVHSSRCARIESGKNPPASDVGGVLEDGADNFIADIMPDGPRVLYFLGGALAGYLVTGWYLGREERAISERAHRDAGMIYKELSEMLAKEK